MEEGKEEKIFISSPLKRDIQGPYCVLFYAVLMAPPTF